MTTRIPTLDSLKAAALERLDKIADEYSSLGFGYRIISAYVKGKQRQLAACTSASEIESILAPPEIDEVDGEIVTGKDTTPEEELMYCCYAARFGELKETALRRFMLLFMETLPDEAGKLMKSQRTIH